MAEFESQTLFTIGHSNRPLDAFLEMLTASDIALLVDVRRLPGSIANPQFNGDALAGSLAAQSIDYLHAPGLAGLRSRNKNSINLAWRNKSFQAYADYMQTDEFRKNLEILLNLASFQATAIMCAEAVPWRCHRSLIADAAVARGWDVLHIMSATSAQPHVLRSFARVEGDRLYYPEPAGA